MVIQYMRWIGFWIALAALLSATHAAAQAPPTTPNLTSPPPPIDSSDLIFGILTVSVPNDDRVWFIYPNLTTIYETPHLWMQFVMTSPFILFDLIGAGIQWLAGDDYPDLLITDALNGEDAPVVVFGYFETSVRGTLTGSGPHIIDLGGLFSVEIFSTLADIPDLSIINGATLAPQLGYRYTGDEMRLSLTSFAGMRFDYDSFDGLVVGSEAALRAAPIDGGFGVFAKARAQFLFNTDSAASERACCVPVILTEVGVLYRWKD